METSLKTGFAQFSLAELPKILGGCNPPGPYAYVYVIMVIKTKNLDVNVYVILLPKRLKHSCIYYSLAFFKFSQIGDFRAEKYLNLVF